LLSAIPGFSCVPDPYSDEDGAELIHSIRLGTVSWSSTTPTAPQTTTGRRWISVIFTLGHEQANPIFDGYLMDLHHPEEARHASCILAERYVIVMIGSIDPPRAAGSSLELGVEANSSSGIKIDSLASFVYACFSLLSLHLLYLVSVQSHKSSR
jgi:hypothetical protein